MIDDLVGLAVAAALDVAAAKASKKHRWVRILLAFVGIFFLAAIAVGIYVTVKYS